jgi:DNA-binding protein HU-beta
LPASNGEYREVSKVPKLFLTSLKVINNLIEVKMNKGELISKIANNLGTTKEKATEHLEAFLDVLVNALVNGEHVTLPGFGTWSTENRAARTGRNPQTGDTIQIKASRVAKFKAGKSLKEAVQDA